MSSKPSPQPAADLERVLAEIDAADATNFWPIDDLNEREALILKHWSTIRAALVRERELREMLKMAQWYLEQDGHKEPAAQIEALLAQPAAGEVRRERG